MNNLLDFETFRLSEWKEIRIKKEDNGTITVSSDENIDDETKTTLIDAVSDDKVIRMNVSGGYEGGDFMKQIKQNIDLIKSIKLSSERIFPEDTNIVKLDKSIPQENIDKIFCIKPTTNKSIGKGEVLLATYYSNVDRILIPSKGGESGDNCYYDNNTEDDNQKVKKYIEVKTGGAAFKNLSTYKTMDGYKSITKDIEDLEKQFGNDELFEYIGGLTCYFYKMKIQKKSDLMFVLFNNEYKGSGTAKPTTTGFLQISISDNIIETYDNIKEIGQCFLSNRLERKGGKLSRDFTISLNNDKIEIFKIER